MTDAEAAEGRQGERTSMDAEVPFCRVCRGEGSAEEPLFFPCRCSGSIKYVHQTCLEEWLEHSNKRYCELCGYKYEFSPLYDPEMPDSMPKRVILLQVVANTVSGFAAVVRSGLIAAMWFCLLPYLVYWVTRFYFWSGHSVMFGPVGLGTTPLPTAAPKDRVVPTATALIQPGLRRFAEFASWHDWYLHSLNNSQVVPVASFTGVIDGAANTALVVYTAVRILVKASVGLLRGVFGIAITDSQLNDLVEQTMEFSVKCIEGLVVTLASVVAFMLMFMLRDWIVTNAPIDDDFIDEADGLIAEDVPIDAGVDANHQRQQLNDDAPEGARQPLQVEGHLMVPENPQHRPMFAHLPDELPALNDLPPDERPMPLPPATHPVPEVHGATDAAPASAAADNRQGTPGETLGSAQSAVADRQLQTAPEGEHVAQYASTDTFGYLSPVSSNSSADIESDDSIANNQGPDVIDSAEHGDAVDFRSISDDYVDEGGLDLMAEPAPRSFESEDAWSIVGAGSSSAADGLALTRQDSPAVPPAEQQDAALPPTFTAEHSRAIYVGADAHRSGNADDGGSDQEADDSGSSSSDFDREMIGHIQRHRGRVPLPDTGVGIEQENEHEGIRQDEHEGIQQNENELGILWAEPRADDGPEALNRGDAAAEQPVALGGNGAFFDDEDINNMGDFDGADGILEVLGFRGPLLNAVQYFVLVFMIVTSVIAVVAWLPYILGRAFAALAPVHVIVRGTHLLMELIDTAGEFVVSMLSLVVWERIRPAVVVLADAAGPLVIRSIALLVPDAREALAGAAGGLWDRLTSPRVQRLLLEKLRESWVVRFLFPWAPAVPANTAPPAAESAGSIRAKVMSALGLGVLSRQLAAVLARAARMAGWAPESAPGAMPVAAPMTGEHKLWKRLVDWGVPLDRMAQRLSEAAAGSTLDDRLLMMAIGHMLGVLLAWVVVAYAPRRMRRGALYGGARMLLRMAKLVFFIVVELTVLPVVYGYCLDLSLVLLLPVPASESLALGYTVLIRHHLAPLFTALIQHRWAWLLTALVEHRWVSIFTHWLLGMLFMVHFARAVMHCRQVMRPGLLWFLRDPNDPDFHPMREILEDPVLLQQYNIARSALMYCGVIVSCIGLSVAATVYAVPATFPIRWTPSTRFSDFPNSVVVMVALLPVAIMWGRPNEVLHFLFSRWWRLVAKAVRLSEFILGERRVLEEGAWVLKGLPWLPVPLAGLWMPTHVVQETFDAFNTTAFDRARTGPLAGALPTGEYVARLQEDIDQALAARHPHVRFVLGGGGNYRVPAIDTVPVVPGRSMLVPVDDNGDPVGDQYDYEAADSPELRGAEENRGRALPDPAPESGFRDRRFRREHYGVIYVPSWLRARLCLVLALGWLAIAAISGATLVLSLTIGRAACSRLGTMPAHDLYALSIGLLVLLVAAVLVFRTSTYLGDTFGRGTDRAAALLDLRRRAVQAWTTAWKIAVTTGVFFGAVPAVFGLVVEVYFVLLIRDRFGAQDVDKVLVRTPLQAMAQNWMFGVLHVCIGISVLRFFPALPWSRQLDRLYTGPPHTWHALRGVVVLAVPLVGTSLVAVAAPFVVATAAMWARGSLSADAAARMVMFEDLHVLAPCIKLVLCVALWLVAARQTRALYRTWARAVRDRVYLVGQQLHNIGEADAGAGEEQAAG